MKPSRPETSGDQLAHVLLVRHEGGSGDFAWRVVHASLRELCDICTCLLCLFMAPLSVVVDRPGLGRDMVIANAVHHPT